MKNKILILGHLGFIGSAISQRLKEDFAGYEIIGESLPNIDLTVTEEALRLSEYFTKETVVIMLAAVKKQLGDNLDTLDANLKIILNVARILEKNPVRRFIYFSSAAVYGEDIHNTEITETTQINTRTYYGISKYTSECILKKVLSNHPESSFVFLRPPLIYGFGDSSKGYGPAGFIWAFLNNSKITLWGDGSELRGFVYVEDIAKIVSALVEYSYCGVLNLASSKSYNFREALEIAREVTRGKSEIDMRERSKDKVDNVFDNSLFQELFPSFVFTNLTDGMQKTFQLEKEQIVKT